MWEHESIERDVNTVSPHSGGDAKDLIHCLRPQKSCFFGFWINITRNYLLVALAQSGKKTQHYHATFRLVSQIEVPITYLFFER